MKQLLYVLVNFQTKHYVEMFKIYLESLSLYSSLKKIDFLIICDKDAKKAIEGLPELSLFNEHFFHLVPKDRSLKTALLRKFDISEFEGFMNYSKILYTDIDILVQGDILDVFESVPAKHNTLYATKEGTFEEKYWYINTYKNGNIDRLKKDGFHSFNSGMFLFKPSKEMQEHFRNVKAFANSYKGKQHFYDQSFMVYYFSMNRLSNTDYMNNIYVMFPDEKKYYRGKIVLHIAGIGRYMEKAAIMREYLDFIKTKKKPLPR